MTKQGRPNDAEVEARIIVKAWKDEAFKQELLRNPKAVLQRELGRELGVVVRLPDDVDVRVLESPPRTLYLVLPSAPAAEIRSELSEEQLEAVAAGVGPLQSFTSLCDCTVKK
jgi:hypothetical protein